MPLYVSFFGYIVLMYDETEYNLQDKYITTLMHNVFICLSCKLYSVSYDNKHHCYDGVAKQLFRSIFQNVCILSLIILLINLIK